MKIFLYYQDNLIKKTNTFLCKEYKECSFLMFYASRIRWLR